MHGAGYALIVRHQRPQVYPAVALPEFRQTGNSRQVNEPSAAAGWRVRTPRSTSSSRSVAPATKRARGPDAAWRERCPSSVRGDL